MLKLMFEQPKADFPELLKLAGYRKVSKEEILKNLNNLSGSFKPMRARTTAEDKRNSLLGQVRSMAIGNISFSELTF